MAAQLPAQRRDLLARYLERAEPHCRFLHDEITTTGRRLLSRMRADEEAESRPRIAV